MATKASSSMELPLCLQEACTIKQSPRADVRCTVFFGIFANNTLDFAKIETTTSKHFTLPEKKNSY